MSWITCKQPAGFFPCGAKFHPDDKEDFIEHLAAHGVDTSALSSTPWWDEEAGFSIAPTDRLSKDTPLAITQFGDGSDSQRRENARAFVNLKAMEGVSKHKTPASAFQGAKVIVEGRGAYVKSASRITTPPVGGLTDASPSTGVVGDLAGVQRDAESIVSKGLKNMSAATKPVEKPAETPGVELPQASPYANAPVVNLAVGSENAAPRVCITTGQGFRDVNAIRSIMELLQKAHPDAVVTNQGRWDGDQLVASIARSLGLGYEMTLPKFLEAKRRGTPLFEETHRMTPEESATVGYMELQKRLATTCIELHVFGTPSGPQRGLIEAFNDVEKGCFAWGSATE